MFHRTVEFSSSGFLDVLPISEILDPLDEEQILFENANKNLHPRKLESCVDTDRQISLKPHEISQADSVKSFEACFRLLQIFLYQFKKHNSHPTAG